WFGMFHLKTHLADQKAILGDTALAEMQTATSDGRIPEGTQGYGVGWAVNKDRFGYRFVSHGGGMSGVCTTLELVPSEKLAVVALANTGCDLPHVVAQEILGTLLPGYAERRAERLAQEKEERERGEKT